MQHHLPNASWPSVDVMRTMPFDYSIHDPRYDDASPVHCPGFKLSPEGRLSCGGKINITNKTKIIKETSISHLPKLVTTFTLFIKANAGRQEDVYLRRRTSRMKLSKYAAYNTYHHCEQCHQYLGFNPRYQVSLKKTQWEV